LAVVVTARGAGIAGSRSSIVAWGIGCPWVS
jgi:hypothetical protein